MALALGAPTFLSFLPRTTEIPGEVAPEDGNQPENAQDAGGSFQASLNPSLASSARDPFPFRPAASEATTPSQGVVFRLEALWEQAGRHLALINGQVVSAQESVGVAILESLSRDAVTLLVDGQRHTLRLGQGVTVDARRSAPTPSDLP